MSRKLSNRANAIKPSPTLSVSKKAKELIAAGNNVINFGVGQPDFNTPDYIKKSAVKAIDENFTRYTAVAGIDELKEAVCRKFKRENNLDYTPENILVSPGAKASLLNTLLTLCDPKDEVLVPVPYWVSYTSQIDLADALPVFLHTDEKNNFKISPEQLENAIQNCSNPKVLMLNSPSNPTGAVYKKEELEEIAKICLKHDIYIISDEIYERLVYDGNKHISIAQISDEVKKIVVIINGVSKAFAMTGWRLGYLAAPKKITQAASRIQAHSTSCVNSITQKACVTALNDDDGSVEEMRKTFEKRREFLTEQLNKIPHVTCVKPEGAFYAMPNISYFLENNNKNINNSIELCTYLLEKFYVALVPGLAFGLDGFVRFSYANSMDNIKEGIKRFKAGLESLI